MAATQPDKNQTTPTYDEGVQRGWADASRDAEYRRVADVLDRDVSHVTTLRDQAQTIRRGLAQVASGGTQYAAAQAADQMVEVLDMLVKDLSVEVEHARADRKAQ